MWKFKCENPIFSSPSNFKNHLYFGSHDCYLYSLQPNTGKLLWKLQSNSFIFSTPSIIVTRDGGHYICCVDSSGCILLVDSKGETVSTYKVDGEVFSTPIIFCNYIIVACRSNCIYIIRINY